MKPILSILLLIILVGCHNNDKNVKKPAPERIIKEFGFTFNNYNYTRDTIRKGENFGSI